MWGVSKFCRGQKFCLVYKNKTDPKGLRVGTGTLGINIVIKVTCKYTSTSILCLHHSDLVGADESCLSGDCGRSVFFSADAISKHKRRKSVTSAPLCQHPKLLHCTTLSLSMCNSPSWTCLVFVKVLLSRIIFTNLLMWLLIWAQVVVNPVDNNRKKLCKISTFLFLDCQLVSQVA